MLWTKVLLVLLLLMMAKEDMKHRAISVWLFVLAVVALVYLKNDSQGWPIFFNDLMLNLGFLSIQFIALFGYFGIRQRKFVNIFNGYFGEGDLVFLILLATYLSFFNFLVFHIVSLFLVLILALYLRHKNPKIPLAGGQAFCLAVLISIDHFNQKMDITQDFWLMSFYPLQN